MKTFLITLFGLGLLGGVGYAAFYGMGRVNNHETRWTEKGRVVAACREAVLEQLKAPATASFSPYERELLQDPVFSDDKNRWLYMGNVDSENGFGANVRTGYGCEAGKDLVLVEVELY